jgi:lipoyl(octanoyl) transferase
MKQQVLFEDLGNNQSYQEVWDLQEKILQQKIAVKSGLRGDDSNGNAFQIVQENIADHLFFVEHNPVYTLGKSGDIRHVLIDDEQRKEQGIEFFKSTGAEILLFMVPGNSWLTPFLTLKIIKRTWAGI